MAAGRKDFQLSDKAFTRKFESAELIMNFAGEPIINRWTDRNRKEILDSRLQTTRKLGRLLELGTKIERHYIAASAIGIYPETGSHTEKSSLQGIGFLSEVVSAWEQEAFILESEETTLSIVRLGVVLSRHGGMLKKLLPFFKMGLGGKIGNGKQAFSWIHIHDLTGAINHIIEKKGSGIYNLVSPGVCSNLDFTRALGNALNRPARLTVPVVALKLKYGKAASVITGGQTVLPERLGEEGFQFKYPELIGALKAIVN